MDISRIFGYNIQNFRIKKFWIYPDFFWIYPEFSDMISRFFLDIYSIFWIPRTEFLKQEFHMTAPPILFPSNPSHINPMHFIQSQCNPVQANPSQSKIRARRLLRKHGYEPHRNPLCPSIAIRGEGGEADAFIQLTQSRWASRRSVAQR